ncbi:hypothetical protein MUK42_35610 [Musa troglodytarum]|uniref:Uncharacterized protein n=1 Tax=Musa troglodytarum TaxID=320322 RepID=A0A9E7K3H9_9LILI|nr:hypothetical protein MUK42_35610 [Musa troglodytarum]
MFGFVTFVYPETMKLILAKGNPHFVYECSSSLTRRKKKGLRQVQEAAIIVKHLLAQFAL